MKTAAVILLVLSRGSLALVMPNHGGSANLRLNSGSGQPELSRRCLLEWAGAFTTLSAFLGPIPAFADVSDGNALPQGAAQFQRVLKVKNDLAVISKRVAESSSDIDQREWDNIGQFLRRLYAAGDDMKGVSGGIYDPTKKTRAEEDIKLLQKYAKAGEGPANMQDGDAFLLVMKKSDELIGDFFEQLRDVPDEI